MAKKPKSKKKPRRARSGPDVHEKLLLDMEAAVTGEEFTYRETWERRRDWPSCLRGSRNMCAMALVNRTEDARRRGDDVVLKECSQDALAFHNHENAYGRWGREPWGKYSGWNVLADTALLKLMRELGGGVGAMLWQQFDRSASMWRLMLPGDGDITVRNSRNKVIYRGWGCRTAGGRHLPSRSVQLCSLVMNATFAEYVGKPHRKMGSKKATEYKIFEALRPFLREIRNTDLQDLWAAAAHPRLSISVPYFVRRFHNGDVETYFTECPAQQTGSTYYVVQSADGATHRRLFPYHDANGAEIPRVRKTPNGPWQTMNQGVGTRQVDRYVCENGCEDRRYVIRAPLLQSEAHVFEFGV